MMSIGGLGEHERAPEDVYEAMSKTKVKKARSQNAETGVVISGIE